MAVFGTFNLPLVLGDEKHKWKLYAEFTVVDILFAYSLILGRLVVNCHGIIINMSALCLKLSALRELAIVRGSQKSTQECYRHSKKSPRKAKMPIDILEKLDCNDPKTGSQQPFLWWLDSLELETAAPGLAVGG